MMMTLLLMVMLVMWMSGTIRSMYPAGRLCLNSSSSWAPNTAASSDWKALSTAGDHLYYFYFLHFNCWLRVCFGLGGN